ncbi:MAG: flagellar hook-basal body complex protein FliE [Deltaproteobacteria bacterium]|nr:MAG: flagellar hook-basal body complex protein FliE [Deltaproteobacteria bacterium]
MKISPADIGPHQGAGGRGRVDGNVLSEFREVLHRSMDELGRLQEGANEKTAEMVLGKAEVHEAMIALEQMNLSLKMIVQIRNKLLTAYEEIMRMQF